MKIAAIILLVSAWAGVEWYLRPEWGGHAFVCGMGVGAALVIIMVERQDAKAREKR